VGLDRGNLASAVSIVLLLTFLLGSTPLALADGAQRDYVKYVIKLDTIVEGTIVDSENEDILVGGASITGVVYSENFSVNENADANGHFMIVLPSGEDHSYILNISALGYDPKTLPESTIKSGEHVNLGKIRINYHPFDLELGENSGSLTRGRSPHDQEVGSHTGEVETTWRLHESLGTTAADNDEAARYNNVEGWRVEERTEQYISGYEQVWVEEGHWETRDRWVDTSHWSDWYYFGSSSREVSQSEYDSWPTGTYYYSYDYTHGGFPTVKREYWKKSTLIYYHGYTGYKYYVGYYEYRRRWISEGHYESYQVWVDTSHWEDDPTRPIYEDRVVGYDIYREHRKWPVYLDYRTDYSPNDWESKQTTVTAIPQNGYQDNVRLETLTDDGVQAALDPDVLTFGSPASATLTLTPQPTTSGSTHLVTVQARDSNGRPVAGKTYELSLSTDPKPSPYTWSQYWYTASWDAPEPGTDIGVWDFLDPGEEEYIITRGGYTVYYSSTGKQDTAPGKMTVGPGWNNGLPRHWDGGTVNIWLTSSCASLFKSYTITPSSCDPSSLLVITIDARVTGDWSGINVMYPGIWGRAASYPTKEQYHGFSWECKIVN
jgi:hypothetical protein